MNRRRRIIQRQIERSERRRRIETMKMLGRQLIWFIPERGANG